MARTGFSTVRITSSIIVIVVSVILFLHPSPHSGTLLCVVAAALLLLVNALFSQSQWWFRPLAVLLFAIISYLLVVEAVHAWMPSADGDGWIAWGFVSLLLLGMSLGQLTYFLHGADRGLVSTPGNKNVQTNH
jgi:hypothetical protein